MGITTVGGIIIPITIVRTGDKAALKKLKLELSTLNKGLAKVNAQTTRNIATNKSFIATTNSQTSATNRNARATGNLSRKQKSFNEVQKKVTKGHRDFLSQFTRVRWAIVNVALITAVAVGLARLSITVLTTRLEFEKLAAVSGQSIDAVKTAFMSIRGETLATNEELITAFQELAKAGFNLQEQQTILAASTRSSLIGFSDLQSTALATAQVIQQFGFEMDMASEISFKMAAAANAGKVDVETLGDALKFSGAIASQTGTSFEEVAASTAILSNKGLQITQIGRGQRQAMLALLSPSKEAESIMRAYGITITDTSGNLKTFTQLIGAIDAGLDGFSEAEKKNVLGRIFPANALTVILESLGATNEEVKKLTTELEFLDDVAEIDSLTLLANQAVTLTAQFEKLKISGSEAIADIIEEFGVLSATREEVDALKDSISGLTSQLNNPQQRDAVKRAMEEFRGRTIRSPFDQFVLGRDDRTDTSERERYARNVKFLEDQVALLTKIVEEQDDVTDSVDDTEKALSRQLTGTEKITAEISVYSDLYEAASEKADKLSSVIERINREIADPSKAKAVADAYITQFLKRVEMEPGLGIAVSKLVGSMVSGVDSTLKNISFDIFEKFFPSRTPKMDLLVDKLISPLRDKFESMNEKLVSAPGMFGSEERKQIMAYDKDLFDLTSRLGFAEIALDNARKEQEEFQESINEVTKALSIETEELDSLQDALSETEAKMSSLSKTRFAGETSTLAVLGKAEIFRKREELAALGVADAQTFINEALALGNDEYDGLFTRLSKVNSEMERNTNAFDAWQRTIKEAITAEVEAGETLGKDVTQRVKQWQTALLGISATQGGAGNKTQLDDFVNKLQLSYDVHFGGMKDNVSNFLNEQQDREIGVFDTSTQLIDALKREIDIRDSLTQQVKKQQIIVNNLTNTLTTMKLANEAYTTEINNMTIEILNIISTIESVTVRFDNVLNQIDSMLNDVPPANNNFGRGNRGIDRIVISPLTGKPVGISGVHESSYPNVQDLLDSNPSLNDFVQRPGQSPVSFSKQDTIIGVKDPSTLGGGNTVEIGAINVSGMSGNPDEIGREIAASIKRELNAA